MKTKFLLVLGAGMFLALAGCAAERWVKPGATDQELDQARKACTEAATERYPPMLEIQNREQNYIGPQFTTCTGAGRFLKCYPTGSRYMPPPVAAVDHNQADRDREIRLCLRANGWEPVKE